MNKAGTQRIETERFFYILIPERARTLPAFLKWFTLGLSLLKSTVQERSARKNTTSGAITIRSMTPVESGPRCRRRI